MGENTLYMYLLILYLKKHSLFTQRLFYENITLQANRLALDMYMHIYSICTNYMTTCVLHDNMYIHT